MILLDDISILRFCAMRKSECECERPAGGDGQPSPALAFDASGQEGLMGNDAPTEEMAPEQLDWGSIDDDDGAFGQISATSGRCEEGELDLAGPAEAENENGLGCAAASVGRSCYGSASAVAELVAGGGEQGPSPDAAVDLTPPGRDGVSGGGVTCGVAKPQPQARDIITYIAPASEGRIEAVNRAHAECAQVGGSPPLGSDGDGSGSLGGLVSSKAGAPLDPRAIGKQLVTDLAPPPRPADGDGSCSYGGPAITAAATAAGASSNPAGTLKVTHPHPPSRFPASELYRSEAPNKPFRAARGSRSYCEAVRLSPAIPRVVSARVNARLQWHASRADSRGRRSPQSKTFKPLKLWGKPGQPAGYKNSFDGRCFRCLGKDHKLAACRDPLRCIACRRSGHLARDCPEKRRLQQLHSRLRFPKPTIHSRLVFPNPQPPSIHNRLTFPPLHPEKEEGEVGVEEEVKEASTAMAYAQGRPENRPEVGAAVVISDATMAHEVTKYRTRAVLLVARSDIKYLGISSDEVALALGRRIRIPRYEATVTRHRPEDFLVLFDHPPQRDMAIIAATVRVRGVDFDVLPWTEYRNGRDITWWYHVQVAIENLPIHVWNPQMARTVLGDDCLFDRIETNTVRKESTDIFFCWVWMWNPDFLHRTKRMTIFPPGAGLTPCLAGGQYRAVLPPPKGRYFDLIVHLDRIEDWSPPQECTPSSPQSGLPSSGFSDSVEYPKIYDFEDWVPGVVDGRRALPRTVCRPQPTPDQRRQDRGDDDDDQRPDRHPRGILDRGRLAFNKLRRPAGQGGSGGGLRERTRSPAPYKYRGAGSREALADDDRGRSAVRGGLGSPRVRDPPRREEADWERRRSRSPARGSQRPDSASPVGIEDHHDTVGGDLGAALLSGALPVATGAPSPPVLHPDPMMEFYKSFCCDVLPEQPVRTVGSWDPMLEENSAVCGQTTGIPLSFSPSPPRPDEMVASPEYRPQSAIWDKITELNEEAAALGYNNVIHFGPGVQLASEDGGQMVTAGITEQVAEMILDERRNNIVDSIFVPCEQPVLPDPEPTTARARVGRKNKAVEGRRRSSRQQAQACSVPVSKRATHRLIRAFEIVGPSEPIGEQAMEAYIRSFQTPMTDKAIKAVRELTSLDSGPVLATSAQLMAAEGGVDVDEALA